MRKRNYIFVSIAVTATIILAGACAHVIEGDILAGQQVKFKASTSYLNSRAETRTAYSGVLYNGYERIDWETGDQFQIFSQKATHANTGVHYADYAVKSVTENNGSSNASINPVEGNGLIWSTGKHSFYCVYPAPAKNAAVSFEESGDDILIHATVPAEQTITWEIANGKATAKPNMDYAYMYAAVMGMTPSSTVNLFFKPMVTAFEITVTSADDDELTLKSFRMTSTGSDSEPWCALSGDFTATITDATTSSNLSTEAATFTCPARDDEGADANNFVTINLTDTAHPTGLTIYKNASNGPTSASFTVFALPQDISKVKLELIAENKDGLSLTRKIALKKIVDPESGESDIVTFSACHKVYINNLGVPGTWTYNMDPIEDVIVSGTNVLTKTQHEVSIHTYKSATGMESIDIPWKLYFCKTAKTPGTIINPSDPEASGCYSTPFTKHEVNSQLADVAYLTPQSALSGTGSPIPFQFQLDTAALSPIYLNSVRINLSNLTPEENHLKALRDHGYTEPVDLSRYNFMDGSTNGSRETANCYIIDGYGSFYFPLVYGNAIRSDAVNTSAYIRTEHNYAAVLSTFLNADGKPIDNAWILSDSKLEKSGDYSGLVVWQDVLEGYEILKESNITIQDGYMHFTIEHDDIKPGNIVLALYDNVKKKVLWSWHLWITGYPLYTRKVTRNSQSVEFLSNNLGWTAPVYYEKRVTKSRVQYAVIVVDDDTDNKGTVLGSVKIAQNVYTFGPFSNTIFSNTYYQFGRKDPFVGTNGVDSWKINKYNSTLHDEFAGQRVNRNQAVSLQDPDNSIRYNLLKNVSLPGSYNEPYRISYAIQNPSTIVHGSFDKQNIWNVTFQQGASHYGTPVVKSVYDPCPRGFSVARASQFLVLMNVGDDSIAQNYYPANPDGEIFGECVTSAPRGLRNGGVRFLTDDGNNDLFFPWNGYRGVSNGASQPDYNGYSRTSDMSDPRDIHYLGGIYHTGESLVLTLVNNRTWADPEDTDRVLNPYNATLFWGFWDQYAMPVRPVVDGSSGAFGATSTGQTKENHDAGGMSWE